MKRTKQQLPANSVTTERSIVSPFKAREAYQLHFAGCFVLQDCADCKRLATAAIAERKKVTDVHN